MLLPRNRIKQEGHLHAVANQGFILSTTKSSLSTTRRRIPKHSWVCPPKQTKEQNLSILLNTYASHMFPQILHLLLTVGESQVDLHNWYLLCLSSHGLCLPHLTSLVFPGAAPFCPLDLRTFKGSSSFGPFSKYSFWLKYNFWLNQYMVFSMSNLETHAFEFRHVFACFCLSCFDTVKQCSGGSWHLTRMAVQHKDQGCYSGPSQVGVRSYICWILSMGQIQA